MPAPIHYFKPMRAVPILGALAVTMSVSFAAHSAGAQSATGTVTGRVLWGACIRGIPLPMTPGGQAQPGTAVSPDAPVPDPQIAPGYRQPVNGLPAGAVLVAVQSTSISARTDEAGKFTLSAVPAGQYMTVAAGPVADSASATAQRPNVFVNGGQSVDVGTLSLGGSATSAFSIPCGLPNGPGIATPDSTPGMAPAPADSTSP